MGEDSDRRPYWWDSAPNCGCCRHLDMEMLCMERRSRFFDQERSPEDEPCDEYQGCLRSHDDSSNLL